jgi:hypothetical protein
VKTSKVEFKKQAKAKSKKRLTGITGDMIISMWVQMENLILFISWRLTDTDPLPKGKRPCKSLRELEKEIKRDLEDGINPAGAKMTVCELYAKHNELKSNVRESTQKSRNQLMKLLQNDKMGNMQIEKVKPSDAKQWVIRMKEQKFAFQTLKAIDIHEGI